MTIESCPACGAPESVRVRAARAKTRELIAENERLRAEIESGWLALGYRRNPQHDVYIADGIKRLREMHAERMDALDGIR